MDLKLDFIDKIADYFEPVEIRGDIAAIKRVRLFILSHLVGPFLGFPIPLYLFANDPNPWPQVHVAVVAIAMFWMFLLALKVMPKFFSFLAILSTFNLNFIILFLSYHYGGASSPFLMWLLITPLLAFFYLGSGKKTSIVVLGQMAIGMILFYGIYRIEGSFPQKIPLTDMVEVTMISMISASLYIFFMASYYASVVDSQSGLIKEIDRHQNTLSDLKKAKEDAERANGAKSDFLAKMSHELRTPLNAVLGYSEILLEDAELDGKGEQIADLQKISAAGKHLLAMVNDILDLSKIEAGKTELYIENVDIDQLLTEIEITARPLAAKNTNSFLLVKDGPIGFANIDLTKCRQAIFNLLSNASKFCQNGKIEFRVSKVDKNGEVILRFAVTDNGVGISQQALGTLFTNFSQANAAVNAKFGGTGLGLSLSRNLCRLMGGDITAKSVFGEGSTFTIELPANMTKIRDAGAGVDQAPSLDVDQSDLDIDGSLIAAQLDLRNFEAGNAGISANAMSATSPKILVIDDDKEYLALVQRILRKEGFSPILTDQPSGALQLARVIKPAAIMLDVLMPEFDGWRVIEDLRKNAETAHIPLVMVSVMDSPNMPPLYNADAFIPKPLDTKQLIKTLKSLMQVSHI